MKDELLRVLNNKLDDINSDINSLEELNDKIDKEENELAYVSKILDVFKSNHDNEIMNFPKLMKDDFNEVLGILGSDVKMAFSSESCNYDGLVYLINGINDGISLTLTDEQKNAIEYLIQSLINKIDEHHAAVEGYNLVKDRYLISDVNILKEKKDNYLNVLDDLTKKQYVDDTDLLQEAMNFSDLDDEKKIDILKFLLEYNADVYKNGTSLEKHESNKIEEEIENDDTNTNETQEDDNLLNNDFYKNDLVSYEEENDNSEVTLPEDNHTEFHFNDIEKASITDLPIFSDYNYDNTVENDKHEEEITYMPIDESLNKEIDNSELQDSDLSFDVKDQNNEEQYTPYEDNNEKLSTSDLHMLLAKYSIQEENNYINELVVGDINSYESIFDILKENDLIDSFKNNSELLINTLLYSNKEDIQKVLNFIKNDLSVDDEDYHVTLKIVVDTIPSIFINNGGNLNNFIKNINVFKELDLNLINLFDFSKELFVASNERILNNLDIVKKYDVEITYQNAKYLLLLHDIGDKLDYYVESVYLDKEKNETFDGIEYINLYTAKLNVVTDETIKRLRYSSENSKKIFGSKPKSLVGEITNLKVNTLDISSEYLNKFFNNEFAILTGDEVREYIKLIHNSSNVGNYSDELDILEKYHHELRYVIEGINISYNKVLRNYSILRSYGIDTKKALHFAVCYNLVITKDEYEKLKNVLDELGGNQ